MSWFNEQAQSDLPTDDRSFVIATANLLQRFEFDLPPRVVRNMLITVDATPDFWTVQKAFEEFALDQFAEGESWPSTNVAIVRQRRLDVATAGMVDHYSLVADQRAHSIIDSLDGKIKNASEYGSIISWASFTYLSQEVETVPEQEASTENIHILEQGENLWDIGRQYNVPVNALIAENEIEDPRHVSVGTEIYIPERIIKKDDSKDIHYELLNPARPMHVAKDGGTKKWSFGGVEKWTDLFSTGRNYPDGHNLMILAVAHVPIEGQTAAYYLDSVSLGDYVTTGLPRYTTGFNWQHLVEGHTPHGTPAVPEATVEQVVADAMKEEDRPELVPEIVEPEVPVRTAPISYKDTFKFLNDDKTPVEYIFKEAVLVTEMDNLYKPKQAGKYDGINIIGTFTKDGIDYARVAVSR
jgi:LysM repeat protein